MQGNRTCSYCQNLELNWQHAVFFLLRGTSGPWTCNTMPGLSVSGFCTQGSDLCQGWPPTTHWASHQYRPRCSEKLIGSHLQPSRGELRSLGSSDVRALWISHISNLVSNDFLFPWICCESKALPVSHNSPCVGCDHCTSGTVEFGVPCHSAVDFRNVAECHNWQRFTRSIQRGAGIWEDHGHP